MLIPSGGKKFERAKAGIYLGTIIDVVELGEVKSNNPRFPNPKVRTRIVWVLNANDSEGRALRYMEQPSSVMTPPGKYRASRMYEISAGVLGTVPVPFDDEVLLHRSNQLVLMQEGEYVNLKAILPVPAGQTPPPVPQGFVRDKDKPKDANGQAATGQAVVQSAAPSIAQPAAPAVAPVVADEDIPF